MDFSSGTLASVPLSAKAVGLAVQPTLIASTARRFVSSEKSRKRPGRRGPIWLTPPSPSSAGARPRRHLAVPARQVCETGIHCQPSDHPEPERDHRRDVGDRVALARDKAAPGDETVDHAHLRQCRLARDLGNLRHLLDAGLEDLAGVLEIAADMSEQN